MARFSSTLGFVVRTVFLLVGMSAAAQAQDKLITFDEIKAISPSAKDELVQAMVDAVPLFEEAGITTSLRMAHFIAQVMTETGGLSRLDGDMDYAFATLLRVFSRRTVSEAKAREVAGKPIELANWIYGARLGNLGRGTMDGWNYRGSGYFEMTGRATYRERGAEAGLPLEEDPELARSGPDALRAALAHWTAQRINTAADDHDRRRVRVLINGPSAHGYEQSKIWFNRAWLRVFEAKEGPGFENATDLAGALIEEEADLFDLILQENGILNEDALADESTAAATRQEALRSYQRELGLPETGLLDDATQEALLDPREWRHAEETAAQAAPPASGLEGSAEVLNSGAAGTETAPPQMIAAEAGLGGIMANPNMRPDLRLAVSRAGAHYSIYEMGDAFLEPSRFKPFSVIGEDTREIVSPTLDYPTRAIVQILLDDARGRTTICTGTMIAKDTVLTAGHCIHTGTPQGTAHENLRVMPGRNLGATPYGSCGVRRSFVLPGWLESASVLDARYYDLGALKLDCDIGNTTGWFGVRTTQEADLGAETIVQGYAADNVEKCPLGRQCRSSDILRILWDQKGFYQNDTFGGTSGAPVFRTDADNILFGVHTNGVHGGEPWRSNNAFTRITPERIGRIAEWIAEQ